MFAFFECYYKNFIFLFGTSKVITFHNMLKTRCGLFWWWLWFTPLISKQRIWRAWVGFNKSLNISLWCEVILWEIEDVHQFYLQVFVEKGFKSFEICYMKLFRCKFFLAKRQLLIFLMPIIVGVQLSYFFFND